MVWDLCVKMAYYNNSRFASMDLKQFYLSIIFFRPMMLTVMTLYNVLL